MKRLLRFIGIAMPKREEKKLFIDLLSEFKNRYVNENDLTDKTVGHYTQRFTNIHLFLATNKLMGLAIDEVRAKHMEDLRSWLMINLKTCAKRHASRHIDFCKSAMRYAVLMEYTGQDWISPIKSQNDRPKPIIHLTSEEVKKMIVYNFQNDIHKIAAKLFAFQCFTGLSYCEIYTYSLTEINGRLWIDSTREKTKKSEYVYLFDEAKDIHDEFGGKLPQIANQTYNRMLKEIASILGIKKVLTTHIGRKTHATLLDEAGVERHTIARQLRHSADVCETTYIAKSHRRTETELNRLGLNGTMLLS